MDWSVLASIPSQPGVYLFKTSRGDIIYVGMAKNLHNRLRNYARGKSQDPSEQVKLREINATAIAVEFIVAESVLAAKIMEDYLIYHLRPPLNGVILPIRYNFLKITTEEEFPRLVHTKDLQLDGGTFFGPFYSFTHSKDVLAELRRLFKIRSCELPDPMPPENQPSPKPCPDFYLGHCLAPCRPEARTSELREIYLRNVNLLVQVLSGDLLPLEAILSRKMEIAAANLDFETATFYRQKRDHLVHSLRRRRMLLTGQAELDAIRRQVAHYLPHLGEATPPPPGQSTVRDHVGFSRWD